jgi:ABC-2 type transport system ATP-binding protein
MIGRLLRAGRWLNGLYVTSNSGATPESGNESTTAEFSLQIDDIAKSFGYTQAVRQFTLQVPKGEVHGLLGPNGSGKSTVMKTVLGLVRPDRGSVRVLGVDPQENPNRVKEIVGYVPEAPRLYEFLTGVEYLDFVADVHGLSDDVKKQRVNEFLQAFELQGQENELISGYSQGMKQKIAIIAALLHKPRILILDEVLNGLDPRSARIVKDLVHQLALEGVASLFSTHVLEIAEAICDEVTIMNHGEIIAEGEVPKLREQAGLPGSTLEEIFLKLTGTGDVQALVEALAK